jgi:hypothetical protein
MGEAEAVENDTVRLEGVGEVCEAIRPELIETEDGEVAGKLSLKAVFLDRFPPAADCLPL